jgi:5-methylcytosine-specific restriction endonuclease McrA
MPRPNRQRPRWIKTCLVCQGEFEVGGKAGSTRKVYCSPRCRGQATRKDIDQHPEIQLASSAWRSRRQEVLERDRHSCRFCGKPTKTVHHLVPRAFGGTHRMSNLAAACYLCHDALDKVIRIMKSLNPDFDIQAWLSSFMEG